MEACGLWSWSRLGRMRSGIVGFAWLESLGVRLRCSQTWSCSMTVVGQRSSNMSGRPRQSSAAPAVEAQFNHRPTETCANHCRLATYHACMHKPYTRYPLRVKSRCMRLLSWYNTANQSFLMIKLWQDRGSVELIELSGPPPRCVAPSLRGRESNYPRIYNRSEDYT